MFIGAILASFSEQTGRLLLKGQLGLQAEAGLASKDLTIPQISMFYLCFKCLQPCSRAAVIRLAYYVLAAIAGRGAALYSAALKKIAFCGLFVGYEMASLLHCGHL